ncbi:MAG: universal stress protein [Peptococcaceae bacterium]|jgi:nucleotide-binding universal stress UspA family protein|nr:universal stress protein [Peptococcaceae bacterium]
MLKILVPVDGSKGAEKALRFAIDLADGKDAEIRLLNVQPSYNTVYVKQFFSKEQIQAFQAEASEEILNQALDITKIFNVPVTTNVRIGDPAKEICTEAKEKAVSLIVMGYRGLGPVKRAIMGSVSTQVLNEKVCPVLIVP